MLAVVVDVTVVVLFVVASVAVFVAAFVVAFVVELAVVVFVVVGLVFAALAFETVAAADRFVGCVQFPFHPTLLPGPQFWFHTHSLEWGGQHWQWGAGLSLRS